jgi:DNA-binding NtrC family response regulator
MQDFEILFVDDDRAILELVNEYLSELGYRIRVTDNGTKALNLIQEQHFDIVFTDFKMPDIDGLALLAAIKEHRPQTEVIIVTGHGSMESAITAMKSGSYDYLQKPFKLDVLKIIIDRIVEEKQLKQANIVLKKRLKERHRYDLLVGISLKMQEIYEIIDRMGTNSPNVLIQGESGTGKELTARVIHRISSRREKAFVPLSCKRITKDLPVSDFHTHLNGLLASADGGTIYLDDLADLAPQMQPLLTESIVSGGFDVRVLAASNHDLKKAVERGSLQKDLVQGLNEVLIEMPPLRQRKEDLCLLINHFLDKYNAAREQRIYNVTPSALDYLLSYSWPGNLIQLENVIERAFALGVELVIDVDHLPEEIRAAGEISKIN